MKLLICGGAGYIGSHANKQFHKNAYKTVTFDNLSTGNAAAVKWGELVTGNLLNQHAIDKLFDQHQFNAVIHFAAKSLVTESLKKPQAYYTNNVIGTINLLEAMRRHHCNTIIFSSSAAIYGNSNTNIITESHNKEPLSPYGSSKWITEQILADYYKHYGINSTSLRYFNAAGADPEGGLGEKHNPETHLIPNILKALHKQTSHFTLYGDDYPTPDGTCIRDYIHVTDLANAHVKALEHQLKKPGKYSFNLGNQQGFSTKQIIQKAEEITQQKLQYTISDRRPGDPAILIANNQQATQHLNWTPHYSSLHNIIKTAWQWEQNPRF